MLKQFEDMRAALEKWSNWHYEVQSAKVGGESIYTAADFSRMFSEAINATEAIINPTKEGEK